MITADSRLRQLSVAALILLALSLPFELDTSWLTIGPFQVTNLELLLGAFLLFALLAVVSERRWRQQEWRLVPSSWLWLWSVLIAGLVLAALLAPEFRGNALKAAGRSLAGLMLAFLVPQVVRNQRQFLAIVLALVVGGLAAVIVGLTELGLGSVQAWLEPFRVQATVAGPYLRLAGPFDYANQAAMFIEATLPLLGALIWLAFGHRRRLLGGLLIAASLVYAEASILTYSRASMVTIFLSNSFVAALVIWQSRGKGLKMATPWLGIAALVMVLAGFNVLQNSVFRLRLATEQDSDWYQLSLQVPEKLSLAAGQTTNVPVVLTNRGSLLWSSQAEKPFRLGGQWYAEEGSKQPGELRWDLARDVEPGQTLTMTVPLVAPSRAGSYFLEWDVVQEGVAWFGSKTGSQTVSRVLVRPAGEAVGFVPDDKEAPATISRGAPIPDRGTLWGAALQLVSERPWLGIGLDNFRLTYGRILGWTDWNQTIHSNNWYIETMVSLGVIGSLPFFAWLALLAWELIRAISGGPQNVWLLALAIGLFSYMIHGLLDYFLLANSTALLFWLLVGLWVIQRRAAVDGSDGVGQAIEDP